MKLVALSDLHGHLPEIPTCDAVLIAGDICPNISSEEQASWLDTEFRRWLEKIKSPTFGVAGNHDFVFQELPERVPDLPWTYLEDSESQFSGLFIYGTPWQPIYQDNAFQISESKLQSKWDLIPDQTDILIVHGPPRYYGDMCKSGVRVGSPTLYERIYAVNPKLVVCGHVHEDRGHWKFGKTQIYNVSLKNRHHKIEYLPTIIYL